MFIDNFMKFYSTTIVKKCFELYAKFNFSSKLADKFTKDVSKSFHRKLVKFNRVVACQKIFNTSIFSSFLFHFSSLTSETIMKLSSFLLNKENHSRIHIIYSLQWLSQKMIITSASLISSSFGYAIGGYFLGIQYGAPVGSLMFELIGSSAVSFFIELLT